MTQEVDMHSISAIIEHVTENAILIKEAGDDIWLPKSQILINGEDARETYVEAGELVEIDMPEWLAKKKGLF